MSDSEANAVATGPSRSDRRDAGLKSDLIETSLAVSGGSWDWPPVSYAENEFILVWWLPEYDDLLRRLVYEYQWAWQSRLHAELYDNVPEAVLRAWRDVDPLCREFAWYNVLGVFAAARAKQLGIFPREPKLVTCSCCSCEFLESHLSSSYIIRLGANQIDVCDRCLSQALHPQGSHTSSPEAITAVLQILSRALQRQPMSKDLNGRIELQHLSREARAMVVQALRVKPAVSRVKELYGSVEAAAAYAATAPVTQLSAYKRPVPLRDAEFTSTDPALYRSLMGPLPQVRIDPDHDRWAYAAELESLVGTGCLALAEAALTELAQPLEPGIPVHLLSQVYGQTARPDQARGVLAAVYGEGTDSSEQVILPRDVRTVTSRPVFYQAIPSLPRGNVRFILVGGPMEYVDRRGEHRCVSGETPNGSCEADLAESVARMNAMVDSKTWVEAAVQTGQGVITSIARAGANPSVYGHHVSYVTSTFREVVKALAGALPKKVAEGAWRIGGAGKSRWSYQREAAHYIYNAHADFTYITVESAPAVCIWAWPDRSDLALQSFADTVAAGTADPVTVILPDVPAFRDFARRYVRAEPMDKVQRALMEEPLYHFPPEAGAKRGTVLSAEFAARLVVQADGTEHDGEVLSGALAYLDAHHTLRLSVWDVLGDSLLREVAQSAPAAVPSFALSAFDRSDMVQWYNQNAEYEDTEALLRPYRLTLLDAVVTA